MSVSVKIIDRSSAWWAIEKLNLDNAVNAMATTILSDARAKAPYDTGALRSDGRVERDGDLARSVHFGDARVPYARRRHFENKKNPQTLYYLRIAGDNVARQGLGRFKRK